MDKLNLIELAERYPDLQIVIRLGDLIEANKALVQEAVNNYKASIIEAHEKEQAETYISEKKAIEILGVSTSTLWRWKNIGYLVPFKSGAKNRYRMSDIEKIMNEKA